jgi:hypothetical protein
LVTISTPRPIEAFALAASGHVTAAAALPGLAKEVAVTTSTAETVETEQRRRRERGTEVRVPTGRRRTVFVIDDSSFVAPQVRFVLEVIMVARAAIDIS